MAISPGTWKVSGTREVYSDSLPRENCVVAEILDGTDDDAALMAASPALLKELKFLVAAFEEAVDYIPEYVAIADKAKAAIAQAEGRTK